MQELKNILQDAEKLKKNGNFAEAAALYEIPYSNDEARKDKWLGWNLAHCLRKGGNPNKALDICREVYKIDPKFEQNNNLYAWCIYDTHIKIIQNENDFMKAAEGIVSLTSQENEYSPFTRTIFSVLEFLKDKPSSQANQILNWINKLNPSLLETKCTTITDKDGKNRELASDLEKYYSFKSKALFESGKFAECIELCEEALSKIKVFHYSNNVWLRRERAHCQAKLGDTETAIAELESILLTKKDWFIQHEIGQLYFELGDKDKALSYCVEAVLNFGDADKKLKLFFLLGEIFESRADTENAINFYKLVYIIRKEQNWSIPPELIKKLKDNKVDSTSISNSQSLLREVKNICSQLKYNPADMKEGIIDSFLPHGKAGFIKTVKNESFYFNRNELKGKFENFNPGTKVTFFTQTGFDKSKNRQTINAVNIKLK